MEKVVVEGLARVPSFSHAVIAGDFVHVAGSLGTMGDTTELVEGGVGPQTTQTIRNIETILEATGLGLDNVVKMNVYLSDMADFQLMNEAYMEAIGDSPPARITVGGVDLALGGAVEIDCVAYRGDDPTAPSTRRRNLSIVRPWHRPTGRSLRRASVSRCCSAVVVATSLWDRRRVPGVVRRRAGCGIPPRRICRRRAHRHLSADPTPPNRGRGRRMAALTLCALSLTDAWRNAGFDSGYTLACLILISVVYVATREGKSVVPLLLVVSGFTATFTVASIILDRPPATVVFARLMIGIPGQALVMWITWQLIQSLADASEHQAKTARIQKALATCSQALLTGRDEQPLTAALRGPSRRHRSRLRLHRHQPASPRTAGDLGDRGGGPGRQRPVGARLLRRGRLQPVPAGHRGPLRWQAGADPGQRPADAGAGPIRGGGHSLGADGPDHDPGPVGGNPGLLRFLAGRCLDRCRGRRVDAGGRHGGRVLGAGVGA